MILIADSGSTKTDWCVIREGRPVRRFETDGTNPFFQAPEQIERTLASQLLPRLDGRPVRSVFFYGAGCAFEEQTAMIRRVLRSLLDVRRVEVGSDMLAAARALCGRDPGIACILGTGSNSCRWDGQRIAEQVSPLGFILGDEGSGAVLGRRLVGDCLKNRLPAGLREKFLDRFGLTPAEILDRVYRQPFPNRFLASLSPFLAEHIAVPEIRALVEESFGDFFRRNVAQYAGSSSLPVHCVGSVAYFYREPLERAAGRLSLRLGTVLRSPIEGLIAYHSTENKI